MSSIAQERDRTGGSDEQRARRHDLEILERGDFERDAGVTAPASESNLTGD